MGGKIDHSIKKGNAPYTFRLSGENYHCLGSLLPLQVRKPQFSQLYIYDTENEVSNRQGVFGDNNSMDDELEMHIINYLKTMLDSNNHLVQAYRMHDARQYKLPSSSEFAAFIVGDIGDAVDNRDIIVTNQSGSLKPISELHPSYTPLQYPLFHPFGEDGYQVNILHKNVSSSSTAASKKVTMREFCAYHIQDRPNTFSTMLNGRRLFQKIFVDKYTMIEAQRLHFIRGKQHELRCDTYQSLRGMQSVGNTDVSTASQRVILPSSFTDGARYMMQNYLDAMCLCRWFGYPDFFITITCNPNWPEVKRFLKDTTLKSKDRPDILCRLFKVKLDAMIKLVKDKSLFGKVQAVVYMIEFQKRGLPHAHICIFMHPGSKIHNTQDVGKFISAKIPNKDSDPDLYKLVSDHMIHGPCGDTNPKCTCMVNKKCSKSFPKMFNDETAVDSQGFKVYKRRDNGQYAVKSDIMMDNRTVVPYNKTLLKQFQAHINVEWCNQDGSIKYASAREATWRIFSFDVHYRIPSVMRLAFHSPGEQLVRRNTDVYELLKKTSLIIWDEAPMIHKHAFETLDRTLNDVMNGDSGNTSEAVLENMRLTAGCRSLDVENIREFADWLLDIGQGNVGGPNDGQSVIDIPDDILILNSVVSMGDLVSFVYPNILDRFNELTYFQDRALLAPLNEVVQEINERMLSIFPGEEVEYQSSDRLAECEDFSEDFDPQLYSPDLLNGLKISGMPNHRLVLKVGVPVMLLRNINHKKGLCNGTRLQIHEIGVRKLSPCIEEINLINLLHHYLEDLHQDVLPFEHVRDWFFYPNQNKVVIKFENGQYKNLNPKQLLSCDDLFLLRELDMLKLFNHRKEIAHLELEREVGLKVKWLAECANYESDYDGYPESLLSDNEGEGY
ncbi:uncharacterized protein LOC143574924 [Bidens hawaiensis]|uniref:uncharacterized protein LOC143574924 n=1 Tax=Bidens hawaiensis TaxID=980011 RepID=UPI00404B8D64